MVTRWYRPLEVVLGLSYNEKIDVFAAGVIDRSIGVSKFIK